MARAILTLKTSSGLSRGEYEYDIPVEDARELEAARIGSFIEKYRYRVYLSPSNLIAEVDVFSGALAPLVLAELEAPSTDQSLDLPAWFGPEVTRDPAYLNAKLALADRPPSLPA
ncbi:hypothetical protein [Aurantimonas aggregata]|uniref:hypothetical protein n=1 Tax=Aurantimonas aggregata TaxID=2047720 RepID=UPI001FE5A010|nr:hypothetical protein [Aurantimonas aggregata]